MLTQISLEIKPNAAPVARAKPVVKPKVWAGSGVDVIKINSAEIAQVMEAAKARKPKVNSIIQAFSGGVAGNGATYRWSFAQGDVCKGPNGKMIWGMMTEIVDEKHQVRGSND